VTVDVDFYSTSYNVDVYEAKTGTKLGTYATASTATTTCPTTAVYDKADPKIFADMDMTAFEAGLKEYVTKTL
jgi:hypothetical protein